jgi:hypothetical protein
MTVLKLSERGAMGVRRNASVSGCDIGPPAEREYAVDPVGVDSNRPSAYLSARFNGSRVLVGTYDRFCEMLIIEISIYYR